MQIRMIGAWPGWLICGPKTGNDGCIRQRNQVVVRLRNQIGPKEDTLVMPAR
jgi:hypothetical protein